MNNLKLRESGMPAEEVWEQFFNPNDLFEKFDLQREKGLGADIACGYGTFTIPLAKLLNTTIYAVDINAEFLTQVQKKAEEQKLANIITQKADISDPDFKLPEKVQFALLFNILHCENPELIVKNVKRNLTEEGRIYVIHWRTDIETPRGPPIEIRPTMDDIKILLTNVGFQMVKEFNSIEQYHYGIIFELKEIDS